MKTTLVAVALAALVAFRPHLAVAVRVDNNSSMKKQNITSLDELYFDGRNLEITYVVSSRCDAIDHDTAATLNAKKSRKKIVSFTVTIQDLSPENDCGGSAQTVMVMAKIDLQDLLDEQYAYFGTRRITVVENVPLTFPPVRANMDVVGSNSGSDNSGGSITPPVSGAIIPPGKVAVTVVNYAPKYHCQLWKRDGASSDGFDGNGGTLDEARRSAANACSRTNNPNCQKYSIDPAHTTCDIQYDVTENVVEYDPASVPAGSTISSWVCTLYKQDGSRDDGFQGTGRNQEEALSSAVAKCRNTNTSICDTYSRDPQHTTCSQAMRYEKPKPVASWACALWKRDGSRNDGFKGSGSTELEARRATISGCQVTNNSRCEAYSMDPNNTQCTMEITQAP